MTRFLFVCICCNTQKGRGEYEASSQHVNVFRCIWDRAVCLLYTTYQGASVCVGYRVDSLCCLLWKTMRGGDEMRVVVVKSPWLFSGLLRCLFGMKKD